MTPITDFALLMFVMAWMREHNLKWMNWVILAVGITEVVGLRLALGHW